MNPFWKTILTTLLGIVSFVGAKISANWIAEHSYRAESAPSAITQMARPAYVPTVRTIKVPNYFRRGTTRRSYRRYRMRH
jgi:hypothetical protein